MNILEKPLFPKQAQSLLAWKASLTTQFLGIDTLFYSASTLSFQSPNRFVKEAELIVMGKHFTTEQLQSLLNILSAHNISCVQLCVPEKIADITGIRLLLNSFPSTLKQSLDKFVQQVALDFALRHCFPDFSKPGLVLMDMDSTTIQIECIDEMARLYGVGLEVSAITHEAMLGKIDFNSSLRTRVSKLKGAPLSLLKKVADSMPWMPGVEILITQLHDAGWKVAIASGGFHYFADRLQEDLGFDFCIANHLEVENGLLTGNVVGEIINAQVKARTLVQLTTQYDCLPTQTIAIGDGANDLLMLQAAGLGIALHAKPIVQQQAHCALVHLDLQGALVLLALTRICKWC
ncbi:phosphoserine phosphatase SerB [Psychromonas sp. CNPT3]|uniref:phosphoserine phosphatase SerB n=1 Tax=Psychromonas sp. CNPT3 TaxID=314282 RepID=UPI0002C0CB7B|nr:phosphoserine phosphatase SerB [Psychromonas sp. CNPT3]AGH81368.1 phosphoserine phosphatase SerB [Psychromonas sp. CNPT3]